ncbi:MAG: radical SAM protein [Actinomycetota bacterium]|nr:radical SAM protein [Actinomycetota bacterium]MDQ3679790.1 radical SAM protein [Actinomycetota bacterium]
MGELRWRLADDDRGQTSLFADEELVERHVGGGEYRGLEFLHVNARRIINEVPRASRVPFRYTVNPYRGCSHACVYCFARPTHEYLGLGLGEDFDTKLVVKVNAVERLRAELAAPRWPGAHIAMGTNTDPYQRCEGKYHLTRGIVGVLGEAANPFSILTKSTLILRDLDVLMAAAERTEVRANFSIGTLDEEVWKATEPGTPHPRRRVDAVARLNRAGIPCGVLVAPVLPGISDRPDQLEAVVGACVEAGAVSISAISLHLRPGVREHFLSWLEANRPELVGEYEKRYRRAYLPPEQQEAVSALVRQLAAQARGHSVSSPGTQPADEARRLSGPRPRSAGTGASVRQLQLGM